MEKSLNRIRHIGTMAVVNPLLKFNSGSRMYMVCSQISQAVVPKCPDVKRILTGMEDQLSDYTFGVRSPDNLQVVAVIEKYKSGIGAKAIRENPLVTVIYHSLETGHFDVFHVESFQNQLDRVHETFGFRYVFTPRMQTLAPHSTLTKGELLSHPPTIFDGVYSNTMTANVAYLSTHATIEDGFEVSEEFLERASPIATGTRVADFGTKYYPLNLYGDDTNYKPFPDIGDRIRPDGLLFALREYDAMLGGIEMTARELRTVDEEHDKLVYAKAGAKVVDVTVHTTTNEGKRTYHTPLGMEALAKKYADRHTEYYDTIIETYRQIMRQTHGKAVIGPELQTLITTAMGNKPNISVKSFDSVKGRKNSIQKTWRATPLDEWRVEVQFEHRFKVGMGAKLTDYHGGKGVVCRVRKAEDMAVDDFGNRADIHVYGKGAVARLNPGQFYEHYINAASRDITTDIRQLMQEGKYKEAKEHLTNYLRIVSPSLTEELQHATQADMDEVLGMLQDDVIRPLIRADDAGLGPDTYRQIRDYRAPNRSPVTFRTPEGQVVRTKDPVLIGPKEMMVLDKLDHKPMAVSGVLRQHHGLSAVQNKNTKYSRPSKEQPARVLGETEDRSVGSIMGKTALAELSDLATNPVSHRAAVRSIATANNPASIDKLVDREVIKRGGRPIQFVKHFGACAGFAIVDSEWRPDQDAE